MLTVSYSVNGKSIKKEELKNIHITRKDYVDYIESLKKKDNNYHKEQSR